MKTVRIVLLLLLCLSWSDIHAADTLGINLQHYRYPFDVKYLHVTVQQQKVQLAYMDVQPAAANGHSVILFHGKNFPGAYWEATANALTKEGYRVIIPDALGFGKSSKPVLQYSFGMLAMLNKQLLDSLGIEKMIVIGHSMGGMLAARFTLSYPGMVEKLVLEDPLGLEDWRAKGAPVVAVDELFEGEKKNTYESILKYHQQYYYPVWKPEYEQWVKVQAGFVGSKGFVQYAFVSALTMDMILTQPVLYEFGKIRCPVLVVIGNEDKTKVVRNAPAGVMQQLGNYRELGKKTAAAIPGAKLIAYDGVGHIPHLQIPEKFHADLIAFLKRER